MPATRSSSESPAPVTSRRDEAAAPGVRGLLFTVLGEFVLSGDGTAWTSALLAVLARLGIEPQATRQALMRMSSAGWLEAQREGRRTRWRLTASARELLTAGAERISSLAGSPPAWGGPWLVVSVRSPESGRRARHGV